MRRRSRWPNRGLHLILLLILGINCSDGDLPTGGPPDGNRPPVVDAGGPYGAVEGEPVQFDGKATVDPDGDALSFLWTFSGHAPTASGVEVTRSFADDETFEVVLVVTDEHGATAADTTTLTITNAAPSVEMSLSATNVDESESVTMTASFTDPGAADAPWAWELDWGDGTTATGSAEQQSQQITGSHSFAVPGEYLVRLTVTDKDGGAGSAQATVTVTSAPPENTAPIAAAGGPYTALEGAAVQLDGSGSADADGDAMTWSWTFSGGPAAATGAQPERTWADDGTFQVVLVVTDEHGASDADTTTATITNAAPTVVLSLSAASVGEAQTMMASASFTDPGTADAPWAWELDWGDGTTVTGSAEQQSQITASHAFAAPGEYEVRVTVTDKDGGAGSAQATVTVTSAPPGNTAPVANAGGPYTADEGTPVQLDGSGSSDPDGDTLAWSWSFDGGPMPATGAQPQRTWSDDGTFEIVLVVTDEHGATAVDTTSATITNVAPSVAVSLSATSVTEGQSVMVTASFSDPGTTDAPWAWELDWGNGTTGTGSADQQSEQITGSHSYAAPGEYVVRVTVMDKDGGTGSAQAVVTVTPSPGEPGPEVEWVWSGGQTASGAVVRTRLAAPSSNVKLRISTDSLFGTWGETPATSTAAGNDVATFDVSGLAPDTRYFYRVVSGSTVNTSRQGAFRTLVAPNTPFSFTFALGSCQSTDTNKGVFTHIRDTAPLFWLQTGDIHYRDLTSTSIDVYRSAYNALHQQSNQAALYRSAAIVHVWDDHDGAGGNDTDGTKAGWPAARAAYRESLPHHPLVEGPGGAIYHSFVVGRVRFVVSDLRSERTSKTATDNASKTMFGTAQKQHFKDQLALAKANGEFIVWVSTVPWIGARTTNADYWAGYDTERQEIASYIESLGIGNRMFVLTGDMHASAIDTGANNVWGGFPVFNAGPLDRAENVKGGPYTWGPVWTNEQFGVVSVTDNGGQTITVQFSARNNATELENHEFTLSLQSVVN
jgi:phosphodiesterase/alkaline phosphatase D-like protein/outer membrane lipoprotein-sorting protein